MLSCFSCRTLFSACLPGAEYSYNDYYESDNLCVPEAIVERIEEIVESFGAYRAHNRLLDVGFGAGSYLSAASKAGWNASGIEVSKPAFEQARKAGLDVFCGQLLEAHYPENYFDVVLAVEVLEHLPRPRELVREISRILRPCGLFWATTPHCEGLSYRLMGLSWSVVSPPEHFQLFSRKGMAMFLKSAGFRQIELRTHGLNVAELFQGLQARISAFAHPKKTNDDPRQTEEVFNRVGSAYSLNIAMMQGRTRKRAKTIINDVLNALRHGDTLKIKAGL